MVPRENVAQEEEVEYDFPHRQSAHCESGVTANLLCCNGYNISEAMVFGIGAGLFFAYMPFVKINYLPLTAFRIQPGGIFKRAVARLGVTTQCHRFRSQQKGMEALDEVLARGIPVGSQVGVYWLPFMPPAFRFHFNAHNIVVYGKEGHDYLISDPVLDEPVRCSAYDLQRARFAKGALAPKGNIYYLLNKPDPTRLRGAVIESIREVCTKMQRIPFPFFGIKGIRYLAKQLGRWPNRLGEERANEYLGQIIRMQEEIGTGGGGFRFIYAAFLEETASVVDNDQLLRLSERLTLIGDRWREFALTGARCCKGKVSCTESYPKLVETLLDCADQEEQIFRDLWTQVK